MNKIITIFLLITACDLQDKPCSILPKPGKYEFSFSLTRGAGCYDFKREFDFYNKEYFKEACVSLCKCESDWISETASCNRNMHFSCSNFSIDCDLSPTGNREGTGRCVYKDAETLCDYSLIIQDGDF